MSARSQVPPGRLARSTITAAGALLGAALGVASGWSAGGGLIWVGLAATAVGLSAVSARPSFTLVVVTVSAALLTATMTGLVRDPSGETAVIGLVRGIFHTLCLVVPALVAAVVRGRRVYVQRGWDLALAEAGEHDARVEQAVTRERDAMAGEIHDGLGHRLTLIAVQAARLSLDDGLPPAATKELQSIRANAAAASDELGETVRLLSERTSGLTASLRCLDLADVVERARASGLDVRSDIAENVESATSDYARGALLRALQEGLTNAAKHAPGTEVTVVVGVHEDEVVLRIGNPAGTTAPRPSATGHGLVALEHRVAVLDGTLSLERDGDFVLTVRLPCSATPSRTAHRPRPARAGLVLAESAASRQGRRRTVLLAWLVPTVLASTAALSTVGYFVYANVAAVLPGERFAAVSVGDAESEVRRVLPPVEMLDAPRTVLPAPPGSACVYYEATVSFFYRDDVFRVCFENDRVVTTDTIRAA